MATALPEWTHLNDADVDALEAPETTMSRPMMEDGIDLVGPVKMTSTGSLPKDTGAKAFAIGIIAFNDDRTMRFSDGDRVRIVPVKGRIKKTETGLVITTGSSIFGTMTLSQLALTDAPLFMPPQMAAEMSMQQFLAYLRGKDWTKVK
jgi:hypothetical protein